MKVRIVISINILLFSCATQPIVEKTWFPHDIIYPQAIAGFIDSFDSRDIYVARNAYYTVLAFIAEMNIAHNENIARARGFDTHTIKRPALINSKPTIIESSVGVTYHWRWDDILEEYVELGPAGDIFLEHLQIIDNSSLHNKLLNYWYLLTGELLGGYINIEYLWENLLNPEYLRSLGFTPMENN